MTDPTGASCLPVFCADGVVAVAVADDDDIDDDDEDVEHALCPLFDWAVNCCSRSL